ncbi:uncharacterized protein LOC127844622 [Dreissena polymorpha]|uniref:Caspase family p20 domain-containing protein n=1 Tax=Dreissena polymorpha TaxID=45954 RepID=A0A9D4N2E7_DREPO|nr:uncharacterized protein LOC127844622 [Dreissena polymorpha]KAH3887840.1 hypothetical protein DPMN_011862 [Dreissena polymorpha]
MATSTTPGIRDVIIIVNEGENNKHFHGHRKGACAERQILHTVFVNKFGFSQFNADCNRDISLGDWDHDKRPTSIQKLNASCCIKCHIKSAQPGDNIKRENNLLVVAICSHGGVDSKGSYISLVGEKETEQLYISELLNFLQTCETLKNKTVIILLESCRGPQEDAGVPMEVVESADTESEAAPKYQGEHVTFVPPETIQLSDVPQNFIIVYGTTPGMVSYSDVKGSWMEQALLEEVEKLEKSRPGEDINFMQLLTRMKGNVARRDTSGNQQNVEAMPEAGSSGEKCVIQSEHRLTKPPMLNLKKN